MRVLLAALLASCSGLSLPVSARRPTLDRRGALSLAPAALASAVAAPAFAATAPKVVVFGGAGTVGSRVVALLVKEGCSVVSVSRSSAEDQADRVLKGLGSAPAGVQYISLDARTGELGGALAGASACVSCVGTAPGSKDQRTANGAANVRIADAAKAAGVTRFVYVSVASQLSDGPGKYLFGDYFKGKAEAEAAVAGDFGPASSLVLRPGIITGGPPGPPGPPGVKEVPADAVARAAVAGALGRKSGVLDGADEIVSGV